jgi:hypothetical protein
MFPFVSVRQKAERLICAWVASENGQDGLTCVWTPEPEQATPGIQETTAEEAGELRWCA